MSHAATNWAIQQRGLKPTTKIVLWHLCDRFNPDYGCFPSQARLAYDCEIGRATLNRHLDDLEACRLIRRIRMVDRRTGQQRPTRYLLGFEPGFDPTGSDDTGPGGDAPFGAEATHAPCPDVRHGPVEGNASDGNGLSPRNPQEPCLDPGHGVMPGPVSHFDAIPCLKNGHSRVSNRDTNPVREPLSKPVKEEEDAQRRAIVSDDFFEELLIALGLDPSALPGWWQGWPPREHVRRWRDDLGLSEEAIIDVARSTRAEHPEPPGGPKALDRAMQRAARRAAQRTPKRTAGAGVGTDTRRASKAQASTTAGSRRGKRHNAGPTPSADERAAFYADLVNSDRFLPASMISNTIRDAMLARGLVTHERLQARGVQ